jgi:hypothetical protein
MILAIGESLSMVVGAETTPETAAKARIIKKREAAPFILKLESM